MKQKQEIPCFVFGFFGYVHNQPDGQIAKTRAIHNLLEEKSGQKVPYFDSETLKSNKLKLIPALFSMLAAKHIIYLPAQRNLKKLFPFIYLFSRLFGKKLHYFVVGGWLPDFLEKNKKTAKRLQKLSGIYVESEQMLHRLKKDQALERVYWFPNFRESTHKASKQKKSESGKKLKMVFLSRINKQKGIDLIFHFMAEQKGKSTYEQMQIDFYGPLYKPDESYFFEQLAIHPNMSYGGVVAPDKVQEVLSAYDLMLFPTRYIKEGCPGAVIDANMVAVPVLASNWRYSSEFVKAGETGFIFDHTDEKRFGEIILDLLENREQLKELKQNAAKFSEKFTADHAWEILSERLINS